MPFRQLVLKAHCNIEEQRHLTESSNREFHEELEQVRVDKQFGRNLRGLTVYVWRSLCFVRIIDCRYRVLRNGRNKSKID